MITPEDRLILWMWADDTDPTYEEVLEHAASMWTSEGPTLAEFIDSYCFLWMDGSMEWIIGDDEEVSLTDPDEFCDSSWK